MNYQIFRPTSGAPTLVATITPRGTQTRRAMGFDYVDMSFEVPQPISFQIGDTVVVYGRNYKLNRFKPLGYVKKGKRHYAYELQFESSFYDTAKVQFRGLGPTNQLTEAQVTIRATAATMIDLMVRNLNRVQSGWQVGLVDVTEMHDFSFIGENCLQVLNNLADTFKSEFWIDNQIIHFQKREQSSGLVLKLGADEALYEVSRGQRNDADLVTRLYAEGGSRNLPKGYGKPAVQLPASVGPYLDAPNAKEVIEHTEVFPEIIPERIGTITSVDADVFTFSDSSLNFDINNQLIPGKKAKIGFQTGSLAGLEFEIQSYNNVSKTFKLVLKTDETAYPDGLPNAILKPAIGDKYALFDIDLPQAYVTDAENRVLVAAQNYIGKYSLIQYEYGALIKPLWVKQTNPNIVLGYSVKIVDADSDIDKVIRISGYSRDLQEPAMYDLELSNTIEIAEIVRQYAKQDKVDQAVSAGVLDVERARKQWAATEELTIMLETLQAEMLLIIAEGGNYSTTIVTETNAEGNPNKFNTTAGIVQHDQYIENGGLWNVAASSITLTQTSPYYVYIKASKANQSATVIYSLTKIAVEDVAGFYHFPFGVLSSVLGGIRILSSTKGYTRITGNDIQTGRIISNDGTVWIDLNNSQIKFGQDGNGLDWGVTKPGQLTVDGHIVARSGTIGDYEIVNGKLQITLQKVTEAGATTDKVITAKGLRATDILVVPDKPSTEAGAMWYSEGTDTPPVPPYILPIATGSVLGGIKVGNGLTIDPNTGVLSASFNPAGYATESWVISNYVPQTRKVNGKALNVDITLSAADVGALSQSVADGRYILNQTNPQAGANLNVVSGVFNGKLIIPNVEDNSAGAIWYGDGTGADPSPVVIPIASATVLGGIKVGSGLTIDPVTGILTAGWTKAEADSRFEFSFTKNSGFNKNFGAVAGTVMQGNDTRVVQAFGWGDHKAMGYWNNAFMAASGVSSADANTVDPNGGFTFSYTANAWLANAAFNHYGGLITFKGSANRGALQIQYGVGHEGETGSRIAFRTEYGTSGGAWRTWKEIWHSGNLRSNLENDAQYVFKSGDVMTGPLTISGSAARRIILRSSSVTGNNYIEFQNSLGVRTAYLGQASSAADAMYYRIDAASDHIFITDGTVRMRVKGDGSVDILNALNLGNAILNGGGNSLRITTASGWLSVGPANTGWSHFSTDRPAYHFDKMLHSAEGFKVYNNLNELSASGLVTSDISLQGSMTISQTAATRNRGIIGLYLTTAAAAIWAMGSSYMIDANGLSLGNLYGMAYRYQLVGGGGGMNYNHSVVFAAGGSVGVQIGLDGRLWAKTSIVAPSIQATTVLQIPSTPSTLAGAIWYQP